MYGGSVVGFIKEFCEIENKVWNTKKLRNLINPTVAGSNPHQVDR